MTNFAIQCIVVYYYKYTCAAYDCFCAAGTHIFAFYMLKIVKRDTIQKVKVGKIIKIINLNK